MKKFSRLLIFILAFQMEVRVRASGDILEQPVACMKSKETCAIQVMGAGFHYAKKDKKLHAGSGSALMRLSQNQWRLVKGSLWVEESKGLEVDTLHGSLSAKYGEYWVIEKEGRILVRNIDSDLTVTFRDGKTLQVPEGFEFSMEGLGVDGRSQYSMVKPIDMKDHLPLWNSLWQGSKADFVAKVKRTKEYWGDLTQKSADLYQALVERKIASDQEAQQKLEEKKRRQALEKAQMREMYRSRVFDR
ncbi:hypothetical protein ACES2L_08740 [Bdellovibrio bacteriovorus]